MDRTRRCVLSLLDSTPTSGPEIAEACGISRAAVWKHIEALRSEGVEIAGTPNGYQLERLPEYGAAGVSFRLEAPFNIVYREHVQSTNDVARTFARNGESDIVVLADSQSRGRGRLDRSWMSPPGGIYMSILVRPSLPPRDTPILTLGAAVATAKAIQSISSNVTIKWPNDLRIGEQKVGGILTEMEGEADQVSWVILGIGLNANQDPEIVPDGATTLEAASGAPIDRGRIVRMVLDFFDEYLTHPERILPEWRMFSDTLGRQVRITTPTDEIYGRAVDIAHPGSLTVDTGEETIDVHIGDCEHLTTPDGSGRDVGVY